MRDSVYAHAPEVHCLYLEFRAVQKMPVVFSSPGAAEMHVLRPFEREGFLCALAYQVALDFRAKSERERKNLGLNVVSEAVAVLYCPDPRAFFHNQVKNRHNHKKASAKARKLAAYNQVVLPDVRKKPAKLAFVRRERSADCLLNPGIHLKRILFAEPQNLEPLVFHRLSVRADPNVTVNHNDKIIIFRWKGKFLLICAVFAKNGIYYICMARNEVKNEYKVS